MDQQAMTHNPHKLHSQSIVALESCVALDVEQLNRNTFGDAALRAEIIALFKEQIAASRAQFEVARNLKSWNFMAHTLRGAAAAVGAMQFCALAERWEREGLPRSARTQAQELADFDAVARRYEVAAAALANP